MKKSMYINQIVRNIIILCFLLYLFFNNVNLMKFMIAPFLICGSLSLVKNICLIIGKDKYAKTIHRFYAIVFLFFAFCFMVFWTYTVVKNNNDLTLLFTIPFWFILLYFVSKYFFKKNQKTVPSKRKARFDIKIVVSSFLVLVVLISGFFCLAIGIKDTYKTNKITKDYVAVTGYFKDYEIYGVQEKWQNNKTVTSTTYRLIYSYEVDGKKYTVETDYGSGTIPNINSTREVKYNPDDPSEAVLVGTNRNNGFIYFGAFFVLGGMVFVLIFLQMKGVFDKIKIDVIGTYIGITFTVVGIGSISLQNGMTSSFAETVKTMGFWILIPIMFIIVGIMQTIKCLFLERKKYNRTKNSSKE